MYINIRFLTVLAVLSLFIALPASAGVLNGHVSAFGGATGTAAYSNSTLSGTLDFAVFTAANFNSSFPSSGYTPTAGQLVYAYQLINTGSDAVTSVAVGLGVDPANNIGTFSIGVDNATSSTLSASEAKWLFAGIAGSDTSFGLAISAPTLPTNSFSTVVDGGLQAFPFPILIPGSTAIPEPATWVLAGLGLVAFQAVRRRTKLIVR